MLANAERMTGEARRAAEEREAQLEAMVESRRRYFGPGSVELGARAATAGANVATVFLGDVSSFHPERGDRRRWGLTYAEGRRPRDYDEDEACEVQIDLEKGLARARRAGCTPERWGEWEDARPYLCRYRSDEEILAAARLIAADEDDAWEAPLHVYLGEGYLDEWQRDDIGLLLDVSAKLIRGAKRP